MRRLGIGVDAGRLRRYIDAINAAIAAEATGSLAHQQEADFASLLVEMSEIIDIATLDPSAFDSHEVLTKLRRINEGPDVIAEEGADTGRDYAFEFSTAALLKATGAFGGFAGDSGDLRLNDGGYLVECKRVSSLKRVRQRLREGRQQLAESIQAGGPAGIIALDLSRPIRIAQGPIRGKNDDDMTEQSELQAKAYIADRVVSHEIYETVHRPGVLGIAVRFVGVGTAGDLGNVRRSNVWNVLMLHEHESEEGLLFRRLVEPFGPGKLVDLTPEELAAARAAVKTRS